MNTEIERENINNEASDENSRPNRRDSLIKHTVDDDQQDGEILKLARNFTNKSAQDGFQSPFEALRNGPLDPNGNNFQPKEWAKAFYNIRYKAEDGVPPRVSGVAFNDLCVWGMGSRTDYQMSVGNAILKLPSLFGHGRNRIDILRNIDGLLLPGEMLCVLGPPGSGCSTLLKTIACDTHGFQVNPKSRINYQGVLPKDMATVFKGEAIYTAEIDAHYPMLSVGDTLYFAALARAPRQIPGGVDRSVYAKHMRDVIMAMFGIGHTVNSPVGNNFVRGVSGGERKRVTIAEAALSYSPLQCWDNSTRGLDSANAIEFCKTLRTQSVIFGTTACVAIYQAPQKAYEVFDKVTVLYEGLQIYFGKATEAKEYFERLGFECPESQTTPDFLTSMTSPSERITRPGFESKVPRTATDFESAWKNSADYQKLVQQIRDYSDEHPIGDLDNHNFTISRQAEKSKYLRKRSPYNLSYLAQIKLCMWREVQRLKKDPSIPIFSLVINIFEALIIASIFFDLPSTTASFFARGAVLFMMILLNIDAFGSLLEIFTLYAKREVVDKHNRYALYHPSAEAISAIIMDLPYKVTNALCCNLVLYFMPHLRREAGAFFFFLLISFTMTLSMSMFFRFFASITKTIEQALAPASIILLGLALYTGFAIPVEYMRGWASWIRWINPISYGFESVMVNEFHGQEFPCAAYIPSGPGYDSLPLGNKACAVQGSAPGLTMVEGSAFVQTAFGYDNANRWRNFGILVAFTIFLTACHLITSELVASKRSKGDVKVFQRGKRQKARAKRMREDEEQANRGVKTDKQEYDLRKLVSGVQRNSSVFHWEDVCYEIHIKGETRVILDHVDGWIKPGTLTALMGVSGAGKTTLLDVLASRTTIGVISGKMLVDGRDRGESFQRNTGYAMQQDLHLPTSTVREALEFSALLRQPPEYTNDEKIQYVDHVIKLLNMEDYADAIVGVQGSGLNVEEMKRLTIGVELVARPKLLLFLDEPTSGLDSQTSWSICNLMENLTQNGQAILCTIHQPSAILFQRFDRLLLLAQGGKTVYFGDVGENSRTMLDYFAMNGGYPCPVGANPAEYMLEVIGAAPGAHTDLDWPTIWRNSREYQEVHEELANLRQLAHQPSAVADDEVSEYQQFAASFRTQTVQVGGRLFQQYWRTPSYIYSKILLAVGCSLFIGFSFFQGENTMQGLQNQMFGVFTFLFVIINVIMQIIPNFTTQRALYEARERQSKTYSWQSFIFSNIIVEFAWNTLVAIFCFVAWYYPIGLYKNAEYTDSTHTRGLLAMLLIWVIFLFGSSFAIMLISGIDSQDVASALANGFAIMLYAFCGVLVGPDSLPGFWIFMYRIDPFTYFTSSFLATSLGNAPIQCANNEYQHFEAPEGMTCFEYMETYISVAGGYVLDSIGSQDCHYCQMNSTNQFLERFHANYSTRWRDFGILWAYVVFNTAAAIALYWFFRVPRKRATNPRAVQKSRKGIAVLEG